METKYIIIGAIIFAILVVIFYIKETINVKKGIDSDEKRKVKEIVEKVTKDKAYKSIYATWEDFSVGGGGRTIKTTTSYSYYAVGFKPGSLYVIPIYFENEDMSFGTPLSFTKENVGMVNAKVGKNWLEIYDLKQKEVVKLMVGPCETKEDKFHPVNIEQKEEFQEFCNFIGEFMKEVNEFHKVEVTGKIGKPLAKKK